jgi:hypothetical protein
LVNSRLRRYIAVCAACAAASATGCFPVSNVCGQTLQTLSGDGGASGCVLPEDCPRGSGTYACTTDGLPLFECVSCDANQCVLHVPVPCQ